jgi:hypothetical protein
LRTARAIAWYAAAGCSADQPCTVGASRSPDQRGGRGGAVGPDRSGRRRRRRRRRRRARRHGGGLPGERAVGFGLVGRYAVDLGPIRWIAASLSCPMTRVCAAAARLNLRRPGFTGSPGAAWSGELLAQGLGLPGRGGRHRIGVAVGFEQLLAGQGDAREARRRTRRARRGGGRVRPAAWLPACRHIPGRCRRPLPRSDP